MHTYIIRGTACGLPFYTTVGLHLAVRMEQLSSTPSFARRRSRVTKASITTYLLSHYCLNNWMNLLAKYSWPFYGQLFKMSSYFTVTVTAYSLLLISVVQPQICSLYSWFTPRPWSMFFWMIACLPGLPSMLATSISGRQSLPSACFSVLLRPSTAPWWQHSSRSCHSIYLGLFPSHPGVHHRL